jgi:hypothetical protein
MRLAMMLGNLLVVVVAAGCASSPPLNTESSTSAIRGAEEVGADAVPLASYHLELAKGELAAAQTLAKDGEKDKAASLLLRAEVDAELAILLSREQAEILRATEAMERVRQLQRDNQ